MKKIIQSSSLAELKEYMLSLGEKSYRAQQLYSGLLRAKSLLEISGISNQLRARLAEEFENEALTVEQAFLSEDGSEKYLYKLSDGNIVEGVVMKYKYGYTLCVSTQVGCRMNCAFCASGLNGLVRNLEAGEMLMQALAVNARLGGGVKPSDRKITNLVLMGSGEPFDNYDNTVKFLRLVSCADGLNISPRNISLSTCGLVPEMHRFASESLPVNLTVSLHSPFDEERREIMPVAKAYSIAQIIDALDNYFSVTHRRYILEYTLIEGKNNTARHAQQLIKLFSGKPCHINIIRLNPVAERGLQPTGDKEAYVFLGMLEKGGLSATLRRQIGVDVGGACGQLRNSFIDGKN